MEYNGPGSIDGGLLDCCTGNWGGLWKRITGDDIIFCEFITIGGFIITFYVIATGGWWNEKVPVIWGDKLLFILLTCFEFCKVYCIFLFYSIWFTVNYWCWWFFIDICLTLLTFG